MPTTNDPATLGGFIGGGIMGAAAVWKAIERVWPRKPTPIAPQTLKALNTQTDLTEQVVSLLREQGELARRTLSITERQGELAKESVGLLRDLHADTRANIVRMEGIAKAIDRPPVLPATVLRAAGSEKG